MGTTIRIFLTDGNPNGLRYGEIGLSTVLGFVIPRNSLEKFGQRDDNNKTGVYILVGEDPDLTGRSKIYIGETDNLLKRLSEHNKNEELDFWETTLAFITKDENLNKAHVKHLESCLIKLAYDSKKATLVNSQKPESVKLSEPEFSDMGKMLEQILTLSPIFGLDAFETIIKTTKAPSEIKQEGIEFSIEGDGYQAKCIFYENTFIIKKDALSRKLEAPRLQDAVKAQRNELISSGVLIGENNNSYKFSQDYSFKSATRAAQVVSGSTVNGNTSLKKGEKTFAEWYQESIDNLEKND